MKTNRKSQNCGMAHMLLTLKTEINKTPERVWPSKR
jgi:hypothetical protein